MEKIYSILPEYYDDWGATWREHIVTESDLESVARGWEKPFDYVRDMVKEFSPSDYIGEIYDDPESTWEVVEARHDLLLFTVRDIREGSPNYRSEFFVPFEEVEYYVAYGLGIL